MEMRYFFGKAETGSETCCTFAALINDVFLWRVSWQCDAETKKPPGYKIESGRVDATNLEALLQLQEIREDEIVAHTGIEQDFIAWAKTGYRSFLSRSK